MNKKLLSIIVDILIVISSGLGIYLTFNGIEFMYQNAMLYYTVQSNICVLIVSLIFIIFKLLKKQIPNWLYVIKYVCTIGITITFLVFTFMLIPQMFGQFNLYLLSLANMTVHFISPVLALLSFILFDKIKVQKFTYLYGTIMPILYSIFIMILTTFKIEPMFYKIDGKMSRFPYFFMDYETNGWFKINDDIWELGFFYWIVIIFIIVVILGKLCLKICKNKK